MGESGEAIDGKEVKKRPCAMNRRRTGQSIRLMEWERTPVSKEDLSEEQIRFLRRDYSSVIKVERDPLDDEGWYLTPLGYVGSIPLDGGLLIHLHPKTDVRNIFRMIEHAFSIDFQLFDTLYQCDTLRDAADALALILAERVLRRVRRGLYRAYLPRESRLESLRGRLDLPRYIRTDWRSDLPCRFGEQTTDNPENGILRYTLELLLRSRTLSERTRPTVRKAWRILARHTTPTSFTARECAGRTYNRLNADYELLHTICRFFLETLLPAYQEGDETSFAFLIDMNLLFERFVAGWLRSRRELEQAGLRVTTQERARVSPASEVTFIFDILVKEKMSGRTVHVIDTKYKIPDKPSNRDIFQVVAYAAQQECRSAILVYPASLPIPLDIEVGDVHVCSIPFPIDGLNEKDINEKGGTLLAALGHVDH